MTLPLDIEAKYELLGQLGAGGMGAIYQVRHRLLDELRVIKVMQPQHADSDSYRQRFHREARAAIRLRHPNVAQVHDYSVDAQGHAYLVMEFIDGITLKELLLDDQPPDLPLTLEIAAQALAALGYLHQQGYLHRDVAPDNLMLCRGLDGGILVKLIDLGLAKEVVGSPELTVSGTFIGKVRYASPEQFRRPILDPDTRSDLYSFGVVLYELLTGVCPIAGNSFEELIAAHLLHPVLDFADTDPAGRVPRGLRRVVIDSLAKAPADRVVSAEELARRIAPFHKTPAPSYRQVRQRYGIRARLLPSAGRANGKADKEPAELRSTLDVRHLGAGPNAPTQPVGGLPTWRRALANWNRWPGVGKLLAAALALGIVIAVVSFVLTGIGQARPEVETRRPSTSQTATVANPGTVVIDAAPWARVIQLADSQGREITLEGRRETPWRTTLPAGQYQLTLEHPDSTAPQIERFEIRADQTTRRTVELDILDADAYFARRGLEAELAEAGS